MKYTSLRCDAIKMIHFSFLPHLLPLLLPSSLSKHAFADRKMCVNEIK